MVQRVADGGSLLVDLNSNKVIGDGSTLTDDRPWRVFYNKYGEPHRFPADPVQFQILTEQGWKLTKPRKAVEKPRTQKMRDGSIYDYGSTANDLTKGELNKMKGGSVATAPTATYYSAHGDILPNLPADPESMRQYLELGLSLTPPANVAVST